MVSPRAAVAVIFSLVAGCSGPDSSADAGGDASMVEERVTPPQIPWLAEGEPPVAAPVLTPCPSGWREVTVDGIVECDPYPEGGPADCADGEAHFVGEAGCRPVGDVCPSGEFAEVSGTIYVLESAAANGDGSRGAPYTSLSQVNWSSLGSGTVVALGPGTYAGSLPLRPGVEVVGACAARTVLTGVDAPVAQVVTVTADGDPAVLRNVTIRGAPQRGVQLGTGHLRVEGVVVDGVLREAFAVSAGDAHLEVADVLIENVTPQLGQGLAFLLLGGTIDAQRLVIRNSTKGGVIIRGEGVAVSMSDAAVLDTVPASGEGGRAFNVDMGATLTLSRVLVERCAEAGVADLEASASLSDVVIRDVAAPRGNPRGYGILVDVGGTLEAERVVLSGVDVFSVSVVNASSLDVTDLVVRDSTPSSVPMTGRGFVVESESTFTGSRVAVARVQDGGLVLLTGARVELSDFSIEATSNEGGKIGVHLHADSASVTVSRGRFDGGYATAINGQNNAQIDLTDVVIRNNHPGAGGFGGRAANIVFGSSLRLSRALLEDLVDVGVLAQHSGSLMSLSDVVVRHVTGTPDGVGGRAVQAQASSRTELERVQMDDLREYGLVVTKATLEAHDFTVSNVARTGAGARGHGVVVADAAATFSRFLSGNNATCGILRLRQRRRERHDSDGLRRVHRGQHHRRLHLGARLRPHVAHRREHALPGQRNQPSNRRPPPTRPGSRRWHRRLSAVMLRW